jgi:hypothetical protein
MADTEELARQKFDAWWADDVSTEALKTGDAQLFALATWQAAYASGKRDGAVEALGKAAKAADDDPEFPGPMPEEMRKLLLIMSLEEQQRIACRATKKCISAAIRSLLSEYEK